MAYLDVIFTIYYSDYENEDLNYNYTISPAQPTPALFSFDSFGNYYSKVYFNTFASFAFYEKINKSRLYNTVPSFKDQVLKFVKENITL